MLRISLRPILVSAVAGYTLACEMRANLGGLEEALIFNTDRDGDFEITQCESDLLFGPRQRRFDEVDNERPSAAAVLNRLPGWLDDYDKNAPHSGLGLRSPHQYRREQMLKEAQILGR